VIVIAIRIGVEREAKTYADALLKPVDADALWRRYRNRFGVRVKKGGERVTAYGCDCG
jgi:hypothetical protein